MVRIRLAKTGKRNDPRWRVGVFDKRTRRDGKAIEYLGSYNQHAEDPGEKLNVDMERVEYWIGKGAQPSETIARLLELKVDA